MREAYLFLQTNSANPDVISVKISDALPATGNLGDGLRTVWVALFKDGDTAFMHAHNTLCRKLVDIDDRTYRVSKSQAIAALETVQLVSQREYIDEQFDEKILNDIHYWKDRYKKRQGRFKTIVNWVGYIAVAYLLFILVFGF